MARIRSPNYPMLSLPEAIKLIEKIHAEEQHLAAPKEVIAKHLGYKSLHGLAGRVISAIEKYGLLEEVSGNKVRVSQLAISILHPMNPEERLSAIQEAALKPPLFAAIREEWDGARPSDTNLRVYLVRNKFASDALDRVIEIYRETMDLVTSESGGYLGGGPAPEAAKHPEKPAVNQQVQPPRPVPGVPMTVSFTGDTLQVSATLGDAESVDKLIKALTANKSLLPEKKPEPSKADESNEE